MQKKLLVIMTLFTIALFIFFLASKKEQKGIAGDIKGKEYTVELGDKGFQPETLEIHAGDWVKFITTLNQPFWPASDLHPTHMIYPEFDPQESIDASKSWSFTFTKVGKWHYHDHLSPYYRGTITVIER